MPQPIRTGVPGIAVFLISGATFVVGGFLGLVVGVAAGSSEVGEVPGATVTETVTAKSRPAGGSGSTSPTPTPKPRPSETVATSFGDGTYRVGAEIKPGTYKAAGGDGCYWQRMRNFEGGLGSIIANDAPSGSTTVTIKSGDKGFKTDGCGRWRRL